MQGLLLKAFLAGPRVNAIPVVYDTLEGPVADFYRSPTININL